MNRFQSNPVRRFSIMIMIGPWFIASFRIPIPAFGEGVDGTEPSPDTVSRLPHEIPPLIAVLEIDTLLQVDRY
jgi:hypothetical protein